MVTASRLNRFVRRAHKSVCRLATPQTGCCRWVLTRDLSGSLGLSVDLNELSTPFCCSGDNHGHGLASPTLQQPVWRACLRIARRRRDDAPNKALAVQDILLLCGNGFTGLGPSAVVSVFPATDVQLFSTHVCGQSEWSRLNLGLSRDPMPSPTAQAGGTILKHLYVPASRNTVGPVRGCVSHRRGRHGRSIQGARHAT